MATINVGGSRNHRKSVDADVPLIPFIDLLLCCIMFLLVTAVWNQLASHDAVQRVPGVDAPDSPARETLRLELVLDHAGYVVSSSAGDHFVIPKVGEEYDLAALRDRLAVYRTADPDQRDLTIGAEDGVLYDAIVQAMDAAAGEGFSALSLSGS